MALVHGIVGIRLEDYKGMITSHQVFVQGQDSITLANIITAVQAYCVLLDKVTDAAGVTAHFLLNFSPTGLKTSPTTPGAILGDGGMFDFSQTSLPYKQAVLIPSFAQGKILNGKINLPDTDVAAWVAKMLASWSTFVQPESKSRNLLSAFLACDSVTRKHRRAETKVSYEVV